MENDQKKIIGMRIKELRGKNGLYQSQVAEKVGVDRASISNYEIGRAVPPWNVLSLLAEIFNTSTDYLLGKTDNPAPSAYVDLENVFIEIVEKLSDGVVFKSEVKAEIIDVLKRKFEVALEKDDPGQFFTPNDLIQIMKRSDYSFYFKNELFDAINNIHRKYEIKKSIDLRGDIFTYDPSIQIQIPILGSIAAGQPIDRIEYIEGYEFVEPDLLRGRQAFALRVKGDSMIGDRIQNGDIVIVVVQEEVNPTDIAVVAVDREEATLKRVKCQNGFCMLVPSNPAMEATLVPAKDVNIIGKVIQVRMNFD